MLKISKIKSWLEDIITNLDGINLNTDPDLTFEDISTKVVLPAVTVIFNRGTILPTGQQLSHKGLIEIWLVAREDGDYEQNIEDIVEAIEGDAYPDVKLAGDSASSPSVVSGYEWEIFPMASEGEFTGKIIVRLQIKLDYYNLSNR